MMVVVMVTNMDTQLSHYYHLVIAPPRTWHRHFTILSNVVGRYHRLCYSENVSEDRQNIDIRCADRAAQ